MPIVSLLDLEQSLKLNQMLMDSNLNGSTAVNNLHLLLKPNSNNANSAILASAIIQQIQQQQNLNNKFYNNNILLNCIKSNLAANLNSSLNSSLTDNPKQMNYGRYKTELCRQFSENGECKYGDKCQFAHGVVDLKDVNRHPKYKTDYCKTFHSKGFCPYGPRCHFIHEFYEKNTEIDSNSKANTKQDKHLKSKSVLNNKQDDVHLNSQIDKQLEAMASSLFSTIAEETPISEPLIENNKVEKLTDPLEEFNQSHSSFACSNGSFSPVIMSSSSSTSVSSATSPTLNKNLKKTHPFENDNVVNKNDHSAKLSKQLLEAVLLNKSINLTSSTSLSQQQAYDESDIYTLLNQVKLNSPASPTPMRTRSSTSSTSSSTSSSSSMSSSSDFFDRTNQSPVKQHNSFLNMNDLHLYALAHQQNDPQLDMISFKSSTSSSSLVNKLNKSTNRYLGPIGKPLDTYETNQQLFANINNLLLTQQQQQAKTINNDLLYKNNRQLNW